MRPKSSGTLMPRENAGYASSAMNCMGLRDHARIGNARQKKGVCEFRDHFIIGYGCK